MEHHNQVMTMTGTMHPSLKSQVRDLTHTIRETIKSQKRAETGFENDR